VIAALAISLVFAARGGEHVRIEVMGAPVHVYRSPNFDARTAKLVLYAHGYFAGIDQLWEEHGLAAQFDATKLNALFIATEAPLGDDDKVVHGRLGAVLREVSKQTGMKIPRGKKIAVAHSGGFRVIIDWIKHGPAVDEIILLDGLYKNEAELAAWLRGKKSRAMTLVSIDTAAKADAFLAKLDPKTKKRVVDLRPEVDHMGVITGGRVLPEILSAR
jgi:hypothetical protein